MQPICPICKQSNFFKVVSNCKENIPLTNKSYTYVECLNCKVISLLPILPYEKEEGKLSSVLGKKASVENFYELGIKSLDSLFGLYITGKESYIPKQGEAFYELYKLGEQPLPVGQRKFLQSKGYEKQLIDCFVLRDMFLYSYFFDSETRYLLNNYPTSPVPTIWLVRLIIKEVISQNIYPSARFKVLNIMIDKCSKYGDRFMQPGYLQDKYDY